MYKLGRNDSNIGRDYKKLLKRLDKDHFVAYNVSQRPVYYCVETQEKLFLLIFFPNRTSELVKKEFIDDFESETQFEKEDLEIEPRRTYVTFNKVTQVIR